MGTIMAQEEAASDGMAEPTASGFRIVRAGDAGAHHAKAQRAALDPDFILHPAIERGMRRMREETSHARGAVVRTLFSMPTLHIASAWFKSGFPLPLHSHDVDCYYQIIAGAMRFGSEEIGKGDGVFIPAGVPYTVTPGAEGVEFLEIRTSPDYDTHYRAKTDVYWDRVVDTRKERAAIWDEEAQPYGLIPADTKAPAQPE